MSFPIGDILIVLTAFFENWFVRHIIVGRRRLKENAMHIIKQ